MIFLILCLSAIQVSDGLRRDRWIVWNVGQGLWTTARVDRDCFHFDVGGEHWPLAAIRALCSGLNHGVTMSHSDWDHVGGLGALATRGGRTCVIAAPRDTVKSAKKKRLWATLPPCPKPDLLDELRWDRPGKSANAESRVFLFERRFLIPGDSPASEEKKWDSANALLLHDVQVLVLGHHGSRTSTSAHLLRRLPNLKIAISSARRKKYGHPHPETVARLREFRIGLLRTEDWGHLVFEL